jgi:hypothetical protein
VGPGIGPGITGSAHTGSAHTGSAHTGSALGSSLRDFLVPQPKHLDWVPPVVAIGSGLVVLIAMIFVDG